jgi:hypothetical protein
MSISPVTICSEAWRSMFGSPVFLVRKLHQRIHSIFSPHDDASTSSSVTSIGTSTRNVLLATKSHAAVASTTSDDFYFDTIDKHYGL